MASLINIIKVEKEITTKSPYIFDPQVGEYFLFLISIPTATVQNSSEYKTTAVLQENPLITCNINFRKTNYSFQGEIYFLNNLTNKQYAVTLYYMDSQYKIESSETIDVPTLKHKCSHYFNPLTGYITYFEGAYVIAPSKRIGNNMHIFCKITENLKISEKETPTKLDSIYKEKEFTDFKIICQDQEFLIHKAVLSQSSPVFRAMFDIPMRESKENQAEIKDFSPSIVELMLHYMYSEEIKNDLSHETLKELMEAANMYQLEDLKKLSLREICKSIKDISDVVNISIFIGAEFKEDLIERIKHINLREF